MNTRVRLILAAVAAVVAGLLTMGFLGGRGGADDDRVIMWAAAVEIPPGTQLTKAMIQQVEVHGSSRRWLAPQALPTAAGEQPGNWWAVRTVKVGEPLVAGTNVATEPVAALPDGTGAASLRLIALVVDEIPPGPGLTGEWVDIWMVAARGSTATQVLAQVRVVAADGELLALLVPEAQVGAVLTATEGARLKLVRRVGEAAR